MNTMESDDQEMRCNGCGCKLGSADLESALRSSRDDNGDFFPEDAISVAGTNSRLLASTDFFASPFDDPYLMGRITALHCVSDLIASGASVQQAIANVVIPEGAAKTQRSVLRDLMRGIRRELDGMGATLSGGHTIVGPRLEAGLTVIGERVGKRIEKSNLRPGDRLYLTRGIGVGVVLAAAMRCRAPGNVFVDTLETMLGRQNGFVEVAHQCGLDAGTDVTGFGLAGHLLEMLRASDVSATIRMDSIPILLGAAELVAEGIQSSLVPENRECEREMIIEGDCRSRDSFAILFDPQTCGGLLFGVPEEQVERFIQLTMEAGLPEPHDIGEITEPPKSTDARVRRLRIE